MIEQGLLELTRKLVGIPSVSPEDSDDASITGESRMADFLASHLADKGFELHWDDRASGRPNLLAEYGARGDSTILIEAHMDTVGVRGMTIPPFDAELRDGCLYGRGACDTKGPMAASLWALRPEVLEAVAEAKRRIVYVAAMGEEKGNVGAERLVDLGLVKADVALVLEPTGLAMVHAHKGSLWFRVVVEGRPGHGSDPARGASAIDAMCEVIAWLRETTDARATRVSDDVLGPPTVNVGSIRGGMAVNIVAGRCEIEVDRRTLPAEDHAEIIGEVRARLAGLIEEGRITAYDVEVTKDTRAWRAPAGSLFRERLGRACEDHGVSAKTVGTGWFSDAGPLSQVCGDVIVFGPGSIEQAHTADEYIDVEELQKGSDIIKDLLMSFAADGGGGIAP